MNRRAAALLFPALLALSLLAYAIALAAGFMSDDYLFLDAMRPAGGARLGAMFHVAGVAFFRPLVALVYVADHCLWGLRAWGYHLTNILFHALNGWLVYQLALVWPLAGLPAGRRRGFALAAAGLFVLLPNHSEAVAWISGRTDLVYATFALGALVAWFRSFPGGRPVWRVMALAFYPLALLAKETAVILPACIAFAAGWLTWRERRNWSTALYRGVGQGLLFLAVVPVYLVARRLAIGAFIGGYGNARQLHFPPLLLAANLAKALIRAVLPPFQPGAPLFVAALLVIVLALFLAFAAFAWWRRPSDRPHGFGGDLVLLIGGFVLALAPVLNLAIAVTSVENERYLYFPSVFVALGLAYAGERLWPAAQMRRACFCCIGLLFLAGLGASNLTWFRAGRMSEALITQFTRGEVRQPAVILNLPDSLRGAYVFRNGICEALRINGRPARDGALTVLATCRLWSVASSPMLTCDGERLNLSLHEPLEKFIPPEGLRRDKWNTFKVEIKPGLRAMQLTLPPADRAADAMYLYDRGRLRELRR